MQYHDTQTFIVPKTTGSQSRTSRCLLKIMTVQDILLTRRGIIGVCMAQVEILIAETPPVQCFYIVDSNTQVSSQVAPESIISVKHCI